MGDIADAMINGDMDCVTGEWLGGGAGYPRTTEPNHPTSINQRNGTTYKYSSKVNGVKKYLKMKTNLKPDEMHDYCIHYLDEVRGLNFTEHDSWESVAQVIQHDFSQFVEYVNNRS